jgi:hypothetical protein
MVAETQVLTRRHFAEEGLRYSDSRRRASTQARRHLAFSLCFISTRKRGFFFLEIKNRVWSNSNPPFVYDVQSLNAGCVRQQNNFLFSILGILKHAAS